MADILMEPAEDGKYGEKIYIKIDQFYGYKTVDETATYIEDEMIRYHLNLCNFKSIIREKQFQQICVSSSTFKTPTYTTAIYFNTNATFATTSTTTTTSTTITNLNKLLEIYKAHLILAALCTTHRKIQTLVVENIVQMFCQTHKTTNALLKQILATHGGYSESDTVCSNQMRILKELKLPIATTTTNPSVATTLLLTPLLVANEPLPKFLQDFNTVTLLSSTGIRVFLTLVIIMLSIIDLLIIFINRLFFIWTLFVNYSTSKTSQRTHSLSLSSSLQAKHDSLKHFTKMLLFPSFPSKAFFIFNYRSKCFHLVMSNFL